MSMLLSGVGSVVVGEPSEVGVFAHWDASSESYSNNDVVSLATDISGNGKDLTDVANGPLFKTNVINGKPAFYFDGALNSFLQNDAFDGASLAEAELFAVLTAVNQSTVPGGSGGLWSIDATAESIHYCFTDGNAYMGFGSTARKSTGNPSQDISQFHVLNISSKANEWIMRINGAEHYSTLVNTFGISEEIQIGQSHTAGVDLVGYIAEIIIYSQVLTAGQRTQTEDYLKAKYGITF